MAFGASRFAVKYTGKYDNIPVWSWVFPQNRSEGFYDYSIAAKPLEFYSKLIGDFPFEKLANVQSTTIYEGVENAGTIFYSQNSVTGKGMAEGLLAHEIAHQWFGDCVTESDWFHVWLSEGFATYLTSMYLEATQGKDIMTSDMTKSRAMILKNSEKHPGPVIDTTITDPMKLLSINSYQKGAWILHMLRDNIGDSTFREGLRLYYSRFRNLNTLSYDFQHVMEEVSGKNLECFFGQWLYINGQPDLKIWSRKNKKERITMIYVEQMQNTLFDFNLDLLFKDISGVRIERIRLKDKITTICLPLTNITSIIPDPDVKLLFRQVY